MLMNYENQLAACFLDSGFLTTKTSEVIDTCSADNAFLVQLDVLNHRCSDWEASFNADTIGGNLTNRESCSFTAAATLQNDALELLKTALVAFDNLVSYGDGVTWSKFRKIFYSNLIFNELDKCILAHCICILYIFRPKTGANIQII